MSRGNTVGSLSNTQHAILVGSLLGDGTLRKQGLRPNALFEVNHAYAWKDYVDWKYESFRGYVLTPPKSRKGNGRRVAYRFTTRSIPVFTKYHSWFYRNRKKFIPRNLKLDPLILATWYMDDGSKSRSSCYLNTQQFERDDQEFLINLLQKTFGITSALNRDKEYYRIRITTQGTEILNRIIRPYILPCFEYKCRYDPVTTDPKGESSVIRQSSHADSHFPNRGYAHRATVRNEMKI